MRKLQFIFMSMLVAMTAGFTSCNNDNNEGPYGASWATVKLLNTNEKNASFYLDSDYYGNLLVGENNVMNFTPREDERIIALFDVLTPESSDYKMTVALQQVFPVLTKDIIFTTETEDYANDPIIISRNNLWVSNGYMNMVFQQKIPASTPHVINLVMDEHYQLEDGYVPMQLFYDTKSTMSERSASVNVSFDLSKVNFEDTKGIVLKMNSAVNGEIKLRINLKNGSGIAVPA